MQLLHSCVERYCRLSCVRRVSLLCSEESAVQNRSSVATDRLFGCIGVKPLGDCVCT